MNEYKSLKKKNSSVFGVLLALLLLFEACALVMLGSRLIFFTEKPASNVFSLMYSDARTTVRKGYVGEDGQFIFPENTAVLPKVPAALMAFRPLDTSRPGLEYESGDAVWNGLTNVELFNISYENGEGKITVDGGDTKVVAPGTYGSYSFTLDNPGEFALEYSLDLSAFWGFSQCEIPIKVRFRTAEGDYAVGSADSYEDVINLNGYMCDSTLGAGRQHTYVLEWEWAFEGDDEYDTFLGNVALEQEVTLTIQIETNAKQSTDPDNSSGDLPVTGDDSSTLRWLILAFLGMGGIYAVLAGKKRRSVREEL